MQRGAHTSRATSTKRTPRAVPTRGVAEVSTDGRSARVASAVGGGGGGGVTRRTVARVRCPLRRRVRLSPEVAGGRRRRMGEGEEAEVASLAV